MINVEIDDKSGFCFGVIHAIEKAEEHLMTNKLLYCIGDIVHNEEEVKRMNNKGLQTITYEQYLNLSNTTVLIRAHGEAPNTYKHAIQNNIKLIDASCPIVLKLQNKIRISMQQLQHENYQLLIFGKKNHPEVNGLIGQTNNKALVISSIKELQTIDFSQNIILFSQTTKSEEEYTEIINFIKKRIENTKVNFIVHDTICRQVSNRKKEIKDFCINKQIIIFVSGKKSSNGQVLFETCKLYNQQTYFVTAIEDIKPQWFTNISRAGICGATSTPKWLMQEIKEYIETL